MEILMEWGPIVAMILLGLYALARMVVVKMAANPAQDGWDDALATMQKIDPYVEKIKAWADPDNPEVPRSPESVENSA